MNTIKALVCFAAVATAAFAAGENRPLHVWVGDLADNNPVIDEFLQHQAKSGQELVSTSSPKVIDFVKNASDTTTFIDVQSFTDGQWITLDSIPNTSAGVRVSVAHCMQRGMSGYAVGVIPRLGPTSRERDDAPATSFLMPRTEGDVSTFGGSVSMYKHGNRWLVIAAAVE